MAKARVYELAKELGVGNKEILEQLKKKNVEVKNSFKPQARKSPKPD